MKKHIRRIILCCIVGVCILFFFKHYDAKEYSVNDQKEYINRVCVMSNIPALSVAVWDNEGEEFLNYSYNDNMINEHTLYELASTTKAFTGLGILQLQESGLLDVNDPVSKYIPEFHPTYHGTEVQITIEQLLNHTSGISVYSLERIPEEPFHKGGLSQSLSFLNGVKLVQEPGLKHDYSTVNYDLLALVIERITGIGYEEYVKTYIFYEIGMTDSFFRTEAIQENVVQGYKQAFFCSYPYNAPVYYGNTAAGYLISDTNDLMKWMKNVNTLFDFENYPIDSENKYYAGWNIYDDYVCHSGNNPNYSSQVYVARNEPIGVFVLSSENGSSVSVIGEGLFKMHRGGTVKIGWISDLYDILDVLFVLVPLLLLYGVLWIPLDSKIKAVIRLIVGCILIFGFIMFPAISPIGYEFCFVWYPGSLVFLIGVTVLLSVYLIARSIVYLRRRSIGS